MIGKNFGLTLSALLRSYRCFCFLVSDLEGGAPGCG